VLRHLTSLPARVAVVGGADTGCQLASIFEDFGAAIWFMGTNGHQGHGRNEEGVSHVHDK
jgi:pyruvate/2-oxoglutarate dehydrogenase complex dihydrolipoamide dehydrogenase (E3) component